MKEQVTTLGGQWVVNRGKIHESEMEMKRYDNAKERLARLTYLPSPIIIKAEAISTGCLSLIDYVPRKALHQPAGSPISLEPPPLTPWEDGSFLASAFGTRYIAFQRALICLRMSRRGEEIPSCLAW